MLFQSSHRYYVWGLHALKQILALLLGGIEIVGRAQKWVCLMSEHHIFPIIVGLATLLVSNRHETPVRGPAKSSKDECAEHNNNYYVNTLERANNAINDTSKILIKMLVLSAMMVTVE